MRLVSFNVDGDERPGAVVPGPDRVDRGWWTWVRGAR
jgi:hypothetical protein